MNTHRAIGLIVAMTLAPLAIGFAQKPSNLRSSGPIPEMKAFTAEGEPVDLQKLCEGKFTILSGGCLTCPEFHRAFKEIEAAKADYAEKGVQFFFFYKSLRHPELNGYVEAQNQSERFLQLARAKETLGTTIPWLADTIDNSMRDGLGAGANSVYLISPKGEILFAQSRIQASALRAALTNHIGPVETPTQARDLDFPAVARARQQNEESVTGVERPEGLVILKSTALAPFDTYYVKLRAEAEPDLLKTGKGRLFLGFYPDPILGAHWNNLTEPMKYTLTLPEGVTATPATAQAKKAEGDMDTKPRQFWVEINGEAPLQPITLNLSYFGCTDTLCLALTHEYQVNFELDDSGARTFGFNRGSRGGGKGKGKGKGKKGRRTE